MKIKYANRPNWTRIVDKTYKSICIDEGDCRGYHVYLGLNKVKEPLWVTYENERVCIVDDGYVWMQHFAIEKNVVLTATYDQDGELVQYYFDIVKSIGTTDEGIPYCEDLFLDIVVLPNGDFYVLDEDELDDAYCGGVITEEEYDLAKAESFRLLSEIKEGKNTLLNSTKILYLTMKEEG